MLTKRNLRVLTITGFLVFLIFFIVQNANTVAVANKNSGRANGVPPSSKLIHSDGDKQEVAAQKQQEKEDSAVNAEIAQIQQEIAGNQGGGGSNSGRTGNKVSAAKDSSSVEFNAAKEYASILEESPMVVFSKSYCPFSSKLKDLLAQEYQFTPSYVVIELDKHEHGAELQKYIGDVTGRSTVPNVVINRVSRGGSDDLRALHKDGKLLDSLKEWGGKQLTVSKNQKPSNN